MRSRPSKTSLDTNDVFVHSLSEVTMKFTLPISPEYVAHWGLWGAVREVYQNALDEASLNKACAASIEYFPVKEELHISTSLGYLSPKSLVLGKTSKRDDKTQRGKFGEGYKLALLVLARLNYPVDVFTGEDRWETAIEHDLTFDSPVLNVYVTPYAASFGTSFVISGVRPAEWITIQNNIRPADEGVTDRVLYEESEKGRIYVGGLYVTTVRGFQCGYAFRPGVVKLDRDRGMIDGFDLAYETSRIWTNLGHSSRLSELLEAEAPDVEYVESHVSAQSQLASDHYHYYTTRHGSAVPVSSQEEIQRASAAGVKWVLVPEKVKAMLRLVGRWFIPTTEPPIERLKNFRKQYRYHLPGGGLQELDEIIQSMEN